MDIEKEREAFEVHIKSTYIMGEQLAKDCGKTLCELYSSEWQSWQAAKDQANKQFENFIDQAIEDSACADERRSLQTLLEDFQEQAND